MYHPDRTGVGRIDGECPGLCDNPTGSDPLESVKDPIIGASPASGRDRLPSDSTVPRSRIRHPNSRTKAGAMAAVRRVFLHDASHDVRAPALCRQHRGVDAGSTAAIALGRVDADRPGRLFLGSPAIFGGLVQSSAPASHDGRAGCPRNFDRLRGEHNRHLFG